MTRLSTVANASMTALSVRRAAKFFFMLITPFFSKFGGEAHKNKSSFPKVGRELLHFKTAGAHANPFYENIPPPALSGSG